MSSSQKLQPAPKNSRAAAKQSALAAFQSPSKPSEAQPRTVGTPDFRKRLSGAYLIQLEAIEPDPNQPRKRVNSEHIQELAASIKALGVLQPISVRYIEATNKYRIIAGECRYRACLKAGLSEIPCWVRTPEENDILLQQVIENWQRSDLNPFELADSLAILCDSNGYNQKQLSEVTGKSKGEISKILSMLELPADVQSIARADESGRVTKHHLYALRQFDEPHQQKLLAAIQDGRYTAAALQELVEKRRTASQTGDRRAANWSRRTFKVSGGTVSLVLRTPFSSDADLIQALREVRKQIQAEQN